MVPVQRVYPPTESLFFRYRLVVTILISKCSKMGDSIATTDRSRSLEKVAAIHTLGAESGKGS